MAADPTTPEGRAELRELLAYATTKGRLVPLGNSIGAEVDHCTCGTGGLEVGHEQYCGVEGPVVMGVEPFDAKLIAAAVNALPSLLDAIDNLTEQRDLVKDIATWEHNAAVSHRDRAKRAEAALSDARDAASRAVDALRDCCGTCAGGALNDILNALEEKR